MKERTEILETLLNGLDVFFPEMCFMNVPGTTDQWYSEFDLDGNLPEHNEYAFCTVVVTDKYLVRDRYGEKEKDLLQLFMDLKGISSEEVAIDYISNILKEQ